MRKAAATLLTAALALAGCKATGDKPAAGARDRAAPASAASRGKDKDGDKVKAPPGWLDAMNQRPGANLGVPKAGTWGDGRDPNFDVAREVKGLLGGMVLSPSGQRVRDVFIQIEAADVPRGEKLAPIGIQTDSQGYFQTTGLTAGLTYTLTAQAKIDGKPHVGVVQTRPPNPIVTIRLQETDALPGTGGGALPPSAGGTPPPGGPKPPPSSGPGGIPPPDDVAPPAGAAAAPAPPPGGGAWSPGGPANRGVPPPNPPAPAPAGRPSRPENIADGPPADPWRRSVPTNIPNPESRPNTPNVPVLPPSITPAPAADPPPRTQSRRTDKGGSFALVDTLNRKWDFDTASHGRVVLVQFLTTSCIPCKKAVPMMTDLQARYGAAGLEVVGVVCDETKERERAALAARYHRDLNLNYAVYVEPGNDPGKVQDRFGVKAYPTLVLLDRAGAVLWRGQANERPALEAAIRDGLR